MAQVLYSALRAPAGTRATAAPARPRHASSRGQALIEFAFISPILLMFMFIIFDFGLGLNHRVVVTNAAREAARYAATGKSIAQVQQRAIEQSEGLVTNASSVEVKFYDTDGDGKLLPGDSVAVKLLYSYSWITPLPKWFPALPSSFEMNACTDMRLEQVPVSAAITTGSSPCS